MKALKYWASCLFTDAVFVWLLYHWQVNGSEGALNAFLFLAWALTILMLVVAGNKDIDRTDFEKKPRPRGFMPYHILSSAALLGAMAWFGFFWLASLHLIGLLGMESARTRDPKPKEATP